jgi:predicted AAA+ superfamily ATPase
MDVVIRKAKDYIFKLFNYFPVVAVTGPRQSGKTTLLRNLFPHYTYISLEDPDARAFAEKDPRSFLNQYNDQVIFDEVQRVPVLFSYLQTMVDQSGKMGQFVLSGSQNFHLMREITQSLAGRVGLCNLLPFDHLELASAGLLPDHFTDVAVKGFYPALYSRQTPSSIFYSNYLRTYVERDIVELVNVKDLRTFRNFVSICAGQVGQLTNLSYLANACGISQPTAKSWISLLETAYVVFLLPPYFENFSKRILKSPKLYFYDTGLACHLLSIKKGEELMMHPAKGAIFENLVVAEVLKQNLHLHRSLQLFFWRDSHGQEIDLLVPQGKDLHIAEIKATTTIQAGLENSLLKFESIVGNRVKSKTLIYGGLEAQTRSEFQVKSWKDAMFV